MPKKSKLPPLVPMKTPAKNPIKTPAMKNPIKTPTSMKQPTKIKPAIGAALPRKNIKTKPPMRGKI